MFRTPAGIGIWTTTASRTGALELPELDPPKGKDGVEVPDKPCRRPGREEGIGPPGKFVFNVSRASNSFPLGPNEVRMSTVAGRKSFSV